MIAVAYELATHHHDPSGRSRLHACAQAPTTARQQRERATASTHRKWDKPGAARLVEVKGSPHEIEDAPAGNGRPRPLSAIPFPT